MSTLLEIKSEEEWHKHTASLPSSTLQIISFHAPWAAPCTQMRTVLETLASSYPVTEPLSTSWVSMNAEEVMDVSDSFDVTAVPYLVLTRNNQVLETVSGSDATKVRAAIEKHAKSSGGSSNGSTAAANNSGSVAKNLSSYTPTAADPATAPQYSSGEVKEDKEALHERLATLVKAAPVMLFMKGTPSAPQCGFSRQTVALLRENSVKYGFFNILADDDVRQGLKEFSDWPTFPQLYVDGELVGGLDIVKEEMANDPDFFKAYSVPKSTPDSAAAS
ncbi:Thioredoxin-like protein [Glarea lozoyensis ATCC 20868]|uniref:Thioredoxin-like protein n=1 Tax=Glarea lozoyensis (strain ATCC 20868 / MF5171) TaxID=1116229 RepID=S3CZ48_GLAL2|nr:Thioredoxin-like protein [Glarea lozoyensis ATCC 20868]EPE30855.1 Thioredoxin-like protein [Glarea lozoyensis ATCC 20868]